MVVLALSFFTAIIVVIVMSVRLFYRTLSIARYADKAGLSFSREDGFEIPLKFGFFVFFSCGHSPRVSNIVYGRMNGSSIYAHDFCYEVGHGTRRLTRYYRVVIIDVPEVSSDLLMWNDIDAAAAPMSIRQISGRYGNWSYAGRRELAECLWHEFSEIADCGVSFEITGGHLLLCVPFAHGKEIQHSELVDRCWNVAQKIRKVGEQCDIEEFVGCGQSA